MYFTQEEIRRFREDTPGAENRIHLNNAGAGLMPRQVAAAINDHIQLETMIGGYEAADKQKEAIGRFYTSAATLFNCKPGEIAFTANATDSFDRAISSIPFEKGDVILTTNEDYTSNQITYLAFAKRFGIQVVRVASLPSGGVDLNHFEECLKQYKPRLAAITHIPTSSGLIQPVNEIGRLCRQYNTLYLLDACQSVGQLPLDVKEIQCDFMSVTSRKFLRGPRGAGFLYVAEHVLQAGYEPLFIDMRGADWIAENQYQPKPDATRFEDWEFAYALVLGTGAAIDYLLQLDQHKVERQVKYLSAYLRTGLQTIPGVTTHDKGQEPGGLVTFHIQGKEPNAVKKELADRNINAVTSHRNFSVIDFTEKKIDWAIRVSPHYYNTIGELDACVEAVKEIAG
ncbi:MAG TPA: aminotransferase class V-fold PLP-dependent enzyme [Chitinophaga sp.]|uniref:aminotransferase class V-fold PLP-dependent enzyme n=1 Tax=Chitinophaga sp. TaxID=1869181 RepID=UPI002C037822|nr:aminotransferase class V-fold PLP-dependent enzyme [Chitinophaga sp.]HVI43711.1 aminotransferase class V-fold PLP-dependent enzyme [Chitinophaga sp.]